MESFKNIKPGDLYQYIDDGLGFYKCNLKPFGFELTCAGGTLPIGDSESTKYHIAIVATSLNKTIKLDFEVSASFDKNLIVFYCFETNSLYGTQHRFFNSFKELK